MSEEGLPLSLLAELVAENRVERIVIAPRGGDQGDLLDLVRAIKSLGVNVTVLPRLLEVVGSSVVVDGGRRSADAGRTPVWLDEVVWFPQASARLRGLGAGACLPGAADGRYRLAIKLDSRGPVLFQQQRIGRDGRPLECPSPDHGRWRRR